MVHDRGTIGGPTVLVPEDDYRFDRNQGQKRPGADLALGKPDAHARPLVRGFPNNFAAIVIRPTEFAVAARVDADALGAQAAPGNDGTIGMIEEPGILFGPAVKGFGRPPA